MAAPTLLACEIAAYTDAQLDQYLVDNQRTVSVQDPHNLPESFIQRLRDRVNNPSRSRPVDLDQVSARLLQVQSREQNRTSPESPTPPLYSLSYDAKRALDIHSPSGSSTPSIPASTDTPDDDEPRRRNVLYESIFYSELVRNGGRPWYPLDRLEKVSRNPVDYQDLLRAWTCRPDDFQVFGRQFARWADFGKWQQNRRNQYKGRIAEYTAWAERKLAKVSFTRPLEFDDDPTRQDKLTTWIEYLTFENNFHHLKYASVGRRRRWCDGQWQKLVDSGVLRPHETREFVLTIRSALEHASEEQDARRALKSAESALSSARQASASGSDMLAALASKLELARQSYDSVRKRLDDIARVVRAVKGLQEKQKMAERHRLLLQWIREQVPLIQEELGLSVDAEAAPAATDGNVAGDQPPAIVEQEDAKAGETSTADAGMRKRGRDSNPDDDKEQPKRQKKCHAHFAETVGIIPGQDTGVIASGSVGSEGTRPP